MGLLAHAVVLLGEDDTEEEEEEEDDEAGGVAGRNAGFVNADDGGGDEAGDDGALQWRWSNMLMPFITTVSMTMCMLYVVPRNMRQSMSMNAGTVGRRVNNVESQSKRGAKRRKPAGMGETGWSGLWASENHDPCVKATLLPRGVCAS